MIRKYLIFELVHGNNRKNRNYIHVEDTIQFKSFFFLPSVQEPKEKFT